MRLGCSAFEVERVCGACSTSGSLEQGASGARVSATGARVKRDWSESEARVKRSVGPLESNSQSSETGEMVVNERA